MPQIPAHMQQIVFNGFGGPNVIELASAAVPQPGPGQVLVQVAAAGINRPDCLQRGGAYPPPPGETGIPGLEIAGTIVALGQGVNQWPVGAQVCALVGSGGYAQYALAAAELCLPVPAGLSLVEAACLPENFFTVYDNVFTRGRLQPGETLLVHGGSSGIGSTAIQLAASLGANVITTAGSAQKCEFCLSLGASHAINYREADFVEAVRQLRGKEGVDVVLDMVGGSYLPRNIQLLALEGRLVQIAFLQSPKIADFDFLPVMLRRLTLTGSTLRPRTIAQKAEIARALLKNVWPLIEQGKVRPRIHAQFALKEAAKAHTMMEASEQMGKIVLIMP
ncbi:MAG: NAD(P)H-quinone oxidoreductase [Hyphomicrobiales bacterium]|nr:NAD(P)H-quinone oxidoreductase [Hyphomicrobiales bacterium]MDE2115379.1 NAD(P)H-quinone oxidoreductase [Hyphomicrobiales bacterium]